MSAINLKISMDDTTRELLCQMLADPIKKQVWINAVDGFRREVERVNEFFTKMAGGQQCIYNTNTKTWENSVVRLERYSPEENIAKWHQKQFSDILERVFPELKDKSLIKAIPTLNSEIEKTNTLLLKIAALEDKLDHGDFSALEDEIATLDAGCLEWVSEIETDSRLNLLEVMLDKAAKDPLKPQSESLKKLFDKIKNASVKNMEQKYGAVIAEAFEHVPIVVAPAPAPLPGVVEPVVAPPAPPRSLEDKLTLYLEGINNVLKAYNSKINDPNLSPLYKLELTSRMQNFNQVSIHILKEVQKGHDVRLDTVKELLEEGENALRTLQEERIPAVVRIINQNERVQTETNQLNNQNINSLISDFNEKLSQFRKTEKKLVNDLENLKESTKIIGALSKSLTGAGVGLSLGAQTIPVIPVALAGATVGTGLLLVGTALRITKLIQGRKKKHLEFLLSLQREQIRNLQPNSH